MVYYSYNLTVFYKTIMKVILEINNKKVKIFRTFLFELKKKEKV